MSVLDFHFLKLELRKQNWRSYIRSNNPVAAALINKMGYQEQERVKVKLEFLCQGDGVVDNIWGKQGDFLFTS